MRRLSLTVGEVNEAFAKPGNQAAADNPETGDPGDTFIDLYVAPVSVPTIGRSLLATPDSSGCAARLKPGQQAIVVAGDGAYSFKGSGYVRGGIFDRIELLQDGQSTRFRDRNHTRLGALAAAGARTCARSPSSSSPRSSSSTRRALAAAAARPAQRRRARQGVPDLRPGLHASRPVPAHRAACAAPAAARARLPANPNRPPQRSRRASPQRRRPLNDADALAPGALTSRSG